jgi:hypothetical protein
MIQRIASTTVANHTEDEGIFLSADSTKAGESDTQ